MKRVLNFLSFVSVLATASIAGATAAAAAANRGVDIAFQRLGDTSMFYQGLLNTGVLDGLRDDQHYTIFAPTNASLAETPPQLYPCFYAAECRPQIAQILRDHIIVGRHDLKDLVTYGNGINTAGPRLVQVEEPYVGDYKVDGRTILSMMEIDGNIIYRVDGLLADSRDLSQFQKASYRSEGATSMTEKDSHNE